LGLWATKWWTFSQADIIFIFGLMRPNRLGCAEKSPEIQLIEAAGG